MSSRLQTIYGPMGLISPALIAAKLAIQRIHLLQLNWDDRVRTNESCKVGTKPAFASRDARLHLALALLAAFD